MINGVAKVNLNTDLLQEFAKNLKKEIPASYAKIGIIGKEANMQHGNEGATNLSIGWRHEMGSLSDNLPRRSFIKDTILKFKKKEIQKDVETILKTLLESYHAKPQEASFTQMYRKALRLLALKIESYIDEAFETGGFGAWQPLSQTTIALRMYKYNSSSKNTKNTEQMIHKILIDTGQLRRSISSAVITKNKI